MFAIIKTGGKQYSVQPGDNIYVEKLNLQDGAKVDFDVLLYSDGDDVRIGAPLLEGVKVEGTIVRQAKGKKIYAFRYKAKKDVRKKMGHRQPYTQVEITAIQG